MKITDAHNHVGQQVTVLGAIAAPPRPTSPEVQEALVSMRDRTGIIRVVASRKRLGDVGFAGLTSLRQGTPLVVIGSLSLDAEGYYALQADRFQVTGPGN
ncbi:MAG: hypothetical protein HYV13_03010 [Candidatus Doudnabacteria bacterium]|nr:hypothetical protein [Candidatus Doudnabacteria bacterium]